MSAKAIWGAGMASLVLVGAASCVGDDPTVSTASADDAGGSDSASSDSGATTAADGESPGSDAGVDSGCPLTTVPASAVSATILQFGALSAAGTTPTDWKTIGYDRDGRCTTAMSTDVCMRPSGATTSSQVDGVNGIDNAWGSAVTPVLESLNNSDPSGYVQTDASGTGTLFLLIKGNAALAVPLVLAKIERNGATATLSAIVPLAPFLAVFAKYIGRFDPSLCSGATLESIEAQLSQAADILGDGTQSPSAACNAISIGATLTTVTSVSTVTLADAGPGACP